MSSTYGEPIPPPVGIDPEFEPLAFDRAKLRPPQVSHRITGHERLLALRPDPAEASVVSVVAPAGYGKSTLLSEWADHDRARVLWVTLDPHDDDPMTLAGYLASALLEGDVLAPGLAEAVRAPTATVWSAFVPRLTAALFEAAPFTLMLDDTHLVTSSASWDVIDWLMLHVPEGAQVVVAGRSVAGSSMPRLEIGGRLAARGIGDLALNDEEAFELLRSEGLQVGREEALSLNRACDGWVSGLLMSGLPADSSPADVTDTAGRERLIDDFLQAEVLDQFDAEEREFLLHVSVLRLASASLCDMVLERSGSHALLERLCDAHAFMSRVGEGWCKLHELLRSALLRQLTQRGPDQVATLRDRAATWHAQHGSPEEAVQYSMESGLVDRTTELIGLLCVREYGAGRQATVVRWLDWAESNGHIAGSPLIVFAASIVLALSGDGERSERWGGSVRQGQEEPPSAEGCRDRDGFCALTAAMQCRRGAEAMLQDAIRAVELIGDDLPWRKSALGALAIAQLMNGLGAEGEVTLRRIIDEGGPAWSDTNARSLAAAFLAARALRAQDLDAAVGLLEHAAAVREEVGTSEQGPQAYIDAVAARVALARDADVEAARRLLAHAQPLRPLMTWACPGLALPLRLELVKAYLAIADVAGARVIVREMADILRRRPGLGTFEAEAEELRRQVAEQTEAVQGPSSLTTAELRLLPWLATHFSFREIGERLYLSTNTVKTEALSTYRKLGASSRSEAVEAAVRVGLLDPASLPGILNASGWTRQTSF